MAYIHQVKYYECDRMGVTHHSNYVRFMEEARIDLLDRLGYGFEKMEAEGIVSPVISLSCNYRKPTTFKDNIEILVSVAEISVFKITLSYAMTVGDETVFTGNSVHCFTKDGKPLKIEESFPDLIPARKR